MQVTKTTKIKALQKLALGKTTRVELAKKYNVHPSTISKWKKGTEFEKLPKSSRKNKVSTPKKKSTKLTMLKPTKKSFVAKSKVDNLKLEYDQLYTDFNKLKNQIKALYKQSINTKVY